MCGICGVLQLDGEPVAAKTIDRMSEQIAHRGPDGHGSWVVGPVALAHRRLAIIDLTETGSQPMGNEDASVQVTYSGEIYNFLALRAQLEALGHRFHSHSDTEVIVHAYEEWAEDSVERFNGHFAFALWDSVKRRLFLARDRFGTRPLYYFADGRMFLAESTSRLSTSTSPFRTSSVISRCSKACDCCLRAAGCQLTRCRLGHL
jgi:asparagine synthase (glutamine-hydrolysing)